MEINESDFQSKTGKRLYYLLMQGGREKELALRSDLSRGASPQRTPPAQSQAKQEFWEPPAAKDADAQEKPRQRKARNAKEPELSDIVEKEQPHPSEKRSWELPKEYQTLTLADAIGYCIRTRNIPEKDQTALLKLEANVVSGRSTLVLGASGSGKSYTLNAVLMMVPADMKEEFADSKQFFNVARKRNGKFCIIHLDELQTFLRGSVNEKDAIRKIGYGEHYDPKQEDGVDCPITAHGVYTCVADSNAYKKRLMDNDKELMRRLDKVEIFLDDEKIVQRNATVVQDQNPAFNSNQRGNLDLKIVQYHNGEAIKRDIPDGTFFNPFAQFFAEYIQDVCREAGRLEESTEVIKGNKAGMLLGTKWYGGQRKFEKGSRFKYISSIEDAFVAKLITDLDLGRESQRFNWHACWESGIESLRASGYPVEIIAAYQARHVSRDNKLYVTNPLTKERVLLADLNQPRPCHLVVTKDLGSVFTEEPAQAAAQAAQCSIDAKAEKQEAKNPQEQYQFPVAVRPKEAEECPIIDADYSVIEDRRALPGERSNLPVPIKGTYRHESENRNASPGLPSKEIKCITCNED